MRQKNKRLCQKIEGGYEAEESVPEYRLKGKIKLGANKIFCDGFRAAVDSLKH